LPSAALLPITNFAPIDPIRWRAAGSKRRRVMFCATSPID